MVVKMEEGWDHIKAAGYAWSHTAASMLAGTLVTIIGIMSASATRVWLRFDKSVSLRNQVAYGADCSIRRRGDASARRPRPLEVWCR